MKAVCYYGKEDLRVETVPDPEILNPRDAIVKITSSAICGSDLHIYDGYIPTMQKGDVLGHEFMGEVVEVGKENTRLQPLATASSCRSRLPAGTASSASAVVVALRQLEPECVDGRENQRLLGVPACSAIRTCTVDIRRPGRVRTGAVRRCRADQGARFVDRRAGVFLVRHLPDRLYGGGELLRFSRAIRLPCGAAARSDNSRSRARIFSAPSA